MTVRVYRGKRFIRRWSKIPVTTLNKVCADYEAGTKLGILARRYHLSVFDLRNFAGRLRLSRPQQYAGRSLGISPRQVLQLRRMYEEWYPLDEIAAHFSTRLRQVTALVRNKRWRRSPEGDPMAITRRKQKVKRLLAQGRTFFESAQMVGMSRSGYGRWVRENFPEEHRRYHQRRKHSAAARATP